MSGSTIGGAHCACIAVAKQSSKLMLNANFLSLRLLGIAAETWLDIGTTCRPARDSQAGMASSWQYSRSSASQNRDAETVGLVRASSGVDQVCGTIVKETGTGRVRGLPRACRCPRVSWQCSYFVQLELTIFNWATLRPKYLLPPDSDFSLCSVFASSSFERGIS